MIRVVVAEDMHIVRRALVALLSLEEDMVVVADVARGDAVLPAAREHHAEVVVLDLDLPGADGFTVAAQLRTHLPSCRILVLTGLGRPANVRRAIQARVSGFLVKDAPADRLTDAIRRVACGERVIDAELASAAIEYGDDPMTERERHVLRVLAEGASVSEVAARLYLSPGTVRNYLSMIMSKLDARNRVDAVRIARECGWI